MRFNVTGFSMQYNDPIGKFHKNYTGTNFVLISASQVGNGISISIGNNDESCHTVMRPGDAVILMENIQKALDENAKIPHIGEAIW